MATDILPISWVNSLGETKSWSIRQIGFDLIWTTFSFGRLSCWKIEGGLWLAYLYACMQRFREETNSWMRGQFTGHVDRAKAPWSTIYTEDKDTRSSCICLLAGVDKATLLLHWSEDRQCLPGTVRCCEDKTVCERKLPMIPPPNTTLPFLVSNTYDESLHNVFIIETYGIY